MGKRKHRTRVYSYIRFSTPEQSMGHSERRQFEAAEEWAKRNKLQLDDQLTDRGLSGYHGDHRTKGALGDFLRQVEEGLIPHGSILLVENIDRLSREGAVNTLREVIFKIWDHGITLQTLGPEETFEPGCDDKPQFIGLLFSIQRAQEESRRKSDLIRASRQRSFEAAREVGRIVTAQCPAWLRVENDEFVVIPEAADTIGQIFDWKQHGMSQRKIESRLNAEASWTPPPRKKADRDAGKKGHGWRTSYIKKILSNRAVIGEYQPHQKVDGKREPCGPPVDGYYPAIVEAEVFHAVQDQLAANKGKGGRTGKKRNIFTHIVKCGYCGGPMRYTDKGKPQWRYLVCDNAARGVECDCHNVRYSEVQELVLESCRHIKPEQVLPSSDEQTATVKALRQRIKASEAELRDINEQIENYIDQIGRTKQPRMRDNYEAKVAQLEERADTINAAEEKDQRELENAESGAKQFKSWKRGLAELMDAITDDDAADIRARLAAHLREFIDRIEVFPVGFKEVADPTTHLVAERGEVVPGRNGRKRRRPAKRGWMPHVETILETFEWSDMQTRPSKRQRAAFERYVLERRMSKEGRFYRIRFKNGERIDVVPPEGLATGWRVMRKSVERLEPDFGSLWHDFVQKHGKKATTAAIG